jgi:hypothetical protein
LSSKRVNGWIDLLQAIFGKRPSEVVARLNGARFFAQELSRVGLNQTLARANDPDDVARDFLLSEIVWRMPGVSADQLEPEAAERMLQLYVGSSFVRFESPGEIASEKFIIETVLPFARSIADKPEARAKIEEILSSAGRRHDRRYWVPWSSSAAD